MVLDINIIRHNPELVRKSEENRYNDAMLLTTVLSLDQDWRKERFNGDSLNKTKNATSKIIAQKMKNKEENGSSDMEMKVQILNLNEMDLTALSIQQLKTLSKDLDAEIIQNKKTISDLEMTRNKYLNQLGNILHKDVIINKNEDFNGIIRQWGDTSSKKPLSHMDLVEMVGGVDFKMASKNSGSRCYSLKEALTYLEDALISFGTHMMHDRDYKRINPPLWMNKDAMEEVAQLNQFDSELYKIACKRSEDPTVDQSDEEKYLIATSEQAIAANFRDTWIARTELPMRIIGVSECFRQEVGSHGRDTRGIFRVHQFKKVEQFCLTSPHDGESEKMFEEMIGNAEDFYKQLGIAYRVVSIVSGELNNAAAIKYDLEGWFPGSGCFRELVSCSNCTDYQARSVKARYGETKKMNEDPEYVHMLNCTLSATTRVICAILETYQTEEGIVVPEVLRPYMPKKYKEIIPYIKKA